MKRVMEIGKDVKVKKGKVRREHVKGLMGIDFTDRNRLEASVDPRADTVGIDSRRGGIKGGGQILSG